jgi:hypothetical protein
LETISVGEKREVLKVELLKMDRCVTRKRDSENFLKMRMFLYILVLYSISSVPQKISIQSAPRPSKGCETAAWRKTVAFM